MGFVTFIPGGLDNLHDPVRLGRISDPRSPIVTALTEAVNVDLDDFGVASRRDGRSRAYTGTPHSLWVTPNGDEAFFSEGGVLKRLNSDYTSTALLTLNSELPVCFEQVNEYTVFSDTTALGYIYNGTAQWFTAPDVTAPDEFKVLMSGGQYLAFYHGILYAALGSVLYMSDGYNLGVADARHNQIPMIGYIRMLAAVEDGIWIATDKNVGFISGTDPAQFTFEFITESAPADGCFTSQYDEAGNRKVCWASREGFFVGSAGGKLENLSKDSVGLPNGSSGTCWIREYNGQEHYIAVITDPTGGNTFTVDPISIDTKYA